MAGTVVATVIKNDTANPPTFQNTSGVEVGQLCRAWAKWAGSTGSINGSFNVSSITRVGVGNYNVNFTNPLPDANYAVAACAGNANNGAGAYTANNYLSNTNSTTMVQISSVIIGSSPVGVDAPSVYAAVFR